MPLALIRAAANITLPELAARLATLGYDRHPEALRKIETGEREAEAGLMAAWAQALGLPGYAIRQDRDLRALLATANEPVAA